MPKKGDNLEMITAASAVDHHKNATITNADTTTIDCIFINPTETGQIGKAGGVAVEITQPTIVLLDADVAGVVWPIVINTVTYAQDRVPKSDGMGLTEIALVEAQTSKPKKDSFL